jgi:hypothetical protein
VNASACRHTWPVAELIQGVLLQVLLQERAMWGSYYQKTPIEPQALVLSANLPQLCCAPHLKLLPLWQHQRRRD